MLVKVGRFLAFTVVPHDCDVLLISETGSTIIMTFGIPSRQFRGLVLYTVQRMVLWYKVGRRRCTDRGRDQGVRTHVRCCL